MLIFKFLNYAKKGKTFELNNNGEMFRDFILDPQQNHKKINLF